VLFEALAAGLPVVASAVTSIREVLEEGRWGTLVPPADPDALAAALEVAVARGRAGDELAQARRDFATAFNPERMVSDYLREARI